MSLLSSLPLRPLFRRAIAVKIPSWFYSLRGAFTLFLLIFFLLQCASALVMNSLVNRTGQNVTASHQLTERQALLDKARMELLTASDNSHGAGINLMQDNQTGSVDSWKSLAESAQASLNQAKTLFAAWQPVENSALKTHFDMLADGLQEQLNGLNKHDIDAFFMVPMQAFQQQFNDAWYQEIARANADAAELNQSTLSSLMRSRNISLLVSALLLAVLMTGGLLLLKGVILPLNGASNRLSRIATGDISGTLHVAKWQASEIRHLTDGINEMQQGLRHIVGEMNAISQAVMNSADRMAAQSSAWGMHNQQQSDAISYINQRLSRVAEEVEHSVTFASHAASQVQEADVLAQQCGKMVTDVDAQMREIVDESGKIASIVTLLDGLSLQTKLLALNAAIESAHAGMYGRSFSVVAKEIGLLSEKSSASTRNIDRLIASTHQHIDSGFAKVQLLESLYADIVQAVAGVVTLLQELQQNASAQSARVNAIAHEINRLNTQVESSQSLTQQGASASEDLVSHAQRLSQSVSRFAL